MGGGPLLYEERGQFRRRGCSGGQPAVCWAVRLGGPALVFSGVLQGARGPPGTCGGAPGARGPWCSRTREPTRGARIRAGTVGLFA